MVARASVDSTHLLIGDQIRLHVEVGQPIGAVVQALIPIVPEESAIEFLGQSRWDTLQNDGSILRLRKDLLLTAWDSGFQRIPPVPVTFQLSGRQDTIFTMDIPIKVIFPQIDTTLADIKPIIGEPARWQDYLPYFLGAIAVALMVALVLFLRKQKARKSLPPPPPVILPPHEIGLKKLAALKEQKSWQRGQIKEYHSELTYILREYLEGRFGIQALEQTTDEILAQLKKTDLSPTMSKKLEEIFFTADLVKFAKAQPPADFHRQAMQDAERFILETKPSPPPTTTDLKNAE